VNGADERVSVVFAMAVLGFDPMIRMCQTEVIPYVDRFS
jgi:hypothetical protein